MKKILVLMTSVILMGSLIAGCGGVKTYIDPAETISVSVDQEFIITLDSNPTTGYDWEESYDSSLLSLVDSEYSPDEKAAGLVGAGGTQYFRFKALKTGNTEITLVYNRSFETEILETKVFNVEIK
ncbi:protease inhibitor I42 family protein [Chloroflexota bacterium]